MKKYYHKSIFKLGGYYIFLRCFPNSDRINICQGIMKRDKEKKKAYDKVWGKQRVLETQQSLRRLKSNGCAICGYNKCSSALDFHHVLPKEKNIRIGHEIFHWKNERISEEVNKCILLCSNCHRELHAKEKLHAAT